MSNPAVTMPIDEVRPQPQVDIVIRWLPATGQLQIAWPAVDDTIKLGLLEMAKATLVEARIKMALGRPDAGLIVPATLAPRTS